MWITEEFGSGYKLMCGIGQVLGFYKTKEEAVAARDAIRAKENGDDFFDEDALWEQHVHDKHVDQEDRMGVPEDQR